MDKSTIEMAILGLEEQRKKIERALAELRTQLGGRSVRKVASAAGEMPTTFQRKRRTMSAEARRKISESMKRRHAQQQEPAERPRSAKQGRSGGLTVAGRRKLSDMMKARWAVKKKTAKKAA